MLFNSIDFAVFLPVVFTLYWFIFFKKLKAQNFLILVASYVFYGWWDWRFLSLILFSTIVDYTVGLGIKKTGSLVKRKALLCVSILVNIGFLGFFKYYNFFLENFVTAFSFFGQNIQPNTLNIILPVGISFYTFQTLSYTIDVYRDKLNPTKDFVAFSAFVSFFPQLVAGPIERATNLLPQFYKKRNFDYTKAVDGSRQILWGLFKKVVIADNCAIYVNDIFANYAGYSGSTLLLGAFLFALQIYGDFSGYSDIAIGTARLFGFNLMQNFAYPYFSRDIAEFWRRWHISLSTWFRDYVYIPLGGSRVSTEKTIRNIFIIFIVSGFWHGANWTFIIWGALNAIYFLPLFLLDQNRSNLEIVAQNTMLPSIKEVLNMGITFLLTLFAWIFFRADNLWHAIQYISKILSNSLFMIPDVRPNKLLLLILIFFVIEWFGRFYKYGGVALFLHKSKFLKVLIYFVLIFSVIYSFFLNPVEDFLYFQF